MKCLAVASEIFPLIKTGGLADVTGALPAALAAQGIATTSLLPGYPSVLEALHKPEEVCTYPDLFGGSARVVHGTAAGLDLLAIDAPHLYARRGNPYLDDRGHDWADNGIRFAALGRVAAWLARGGVANFTPDVLHLHDWQAGLTAAYLRQEKAPRPAIVATIHNLAFQGIFPAAMLRSLRLDDALYTPDGIEYHGSISYLKASLVYADRITTVSPSYADEICTPEGGMGLDGVLRWRTHHLQGILNGIDTDVWNPETDSLIPVQYSRRRPAARAANKAELQRRFGLTVEPECLLLGVVGRMSWQKGLDLLLDALPAAHGAGAQLAVLGSGEPALEGRFRAANAAAPEYAGCIIGYDEEISHLMQAGADALLVPSRFEPCGLTQLCALRYGAVPVVARTGGLADTIIHANEASLAADVATGVQFNPGSRAALEQAIQRTAALWHAQTHWRKIQRNGMATDVSWSERAGHYAALFRCLRPGAA